MNKITLFLILLFTTAFGYSQKDSIKLVPKQRQISLESTKLIQKKGYHIVGYQYYIKDLIKVEKNDNYTLSDSLGNIFPIAAKEDAIFYDAKNKIVLAYNRKENNGRDVHLYDLTGKEITIQPNSIFKNPKIHIAPYVVLGNDGGGTIFLTPKGSGGGKKFNTPYGDYLTIMEDNPNDGMSYVKLADALGNLFIKEDYTNIEWIGDKYLLLVKNNIYTIFDLTTKQVLPVQFQDVWKHDLDPQFYYTGGLIAKNNGKYGYYDLITKKWTVPATYDKLEYFEKFGTYDKRKDPNTFSDYNYYLHTHVLVAEIKDKKGVVTIKNELLVPIKYDKIYYGDNLYGINAGDKTNYYDVANKKELFPKFYKQISLRSGNKAITKNEYEQYLDYKTNEVIIPESEKAVDLRLYLHNILLEYADKTTALYSNELKKIVCSNVRRIDNIDGTQSYFRIARESDDYTKNDYIIDANGNIIVNYTYFNGKVKFENKLFVVFNALKESEIYKYYNVKGEKVDQSGKSPLDGNRFMPKK